MKEDFVTYEIAVKLKEKGFKEYCEHGYFLENDRDILYTPTIYQVLKWLREEKKLHVSIMTFMFKAGWCYEVVRLSENPNLVVTHRNSYNTYEQASIEGITWVLDNLI